MAIRFAPSLSAAGGAAQPYVVSGAILPAHCQGDGPVTTNEASPAGALHGYRIIDISQVISGPVATRILGDQGADVIKIEPRTGDLTRGLGGGSRGMAPIFATSNRNKRSLVLDLKRPEGVEIVKKLVAGADVFVQNFRPGAAEGLGIGETALRNANPRLIYVSISGFGERGPYAHKRVYDPVVQGLSGLAAIQGGPRGKPQMMRLIVPDLQFQKLRQRSLLTILLFLFHY